MPPKRPKTKRLVILGSTGSIGQQTLDVVRVLLRDESRSFSGTCSVSARHRTQRNA